MAKLTEGSSERGGPGEADEADDHGAHASDEVADRLAKGRRLPKARA
jgi:hypothetical protein